MKSTKHRIPGFIFPVSGFPINPPKNHPMKTPLHPSRFIMAVTLLILSGCTSPKTAWTELEQSPQDPQVAKAEKLFNDGYLRKFAVATVLPGNNASAQAGLTDLKTRYLSRMTPDLLKAERLFETGKKQAAIEACEAIAAKTPEAVGLAELRGRITRVLAPEVLAAEHLFEQGKTKEAIFACIDIAKKKPETLGLADLQSKITLRLAKERREAAEKRSEATFELHTADAKRFAVSPETYRQKKYVVGDNSSLRSVPTSMQKALANPISVHLVNADINSIIDQIGKSENINIIADSEISPKALTIHAEKTPLIEILEYIGRNLNVTFSVGDNLIWVTPKEEQTSSLPMETRIYPLRKGMVGSELGKTPHGVTLFKGPEERDSSRSSPLQEEKKEEKGGLVGLIESIQRFVPQPEGADFLFNDKVHALIVKNSRENLEAVEKLIEALDVRPLQVLIEARFVATKANDLRELGIDWLYQKPPGDRTAEYDNYTIKQLQAVQKNIADSLFSGSEGDYDYTDIEAINNDIKNLVPNGDFLKDSGEIAINGAGANGFYQTLLGESGFQATLHALQSRGDSRTIIVPRVTTMNNREANFRFGQDVSYFEDVETSLMTSGGGYGNNDSRDNATYDYDRPTIVEVGYALSVTPSVGADLSTINLVLRPEISKIDDWATYKLSNLGSTPDSSKKSSSDDEISEDPAIRLPIISRQYIETEAVVRSGETIVLGGLVDTAKKEETSGTPWLSDLPFLGWLFKTESKEEENINILIFVTATLISDAGEELIPLNHIERYGRSVPESAKVPDVLKEEAPAAESPLTAATPVPAAAPAPAVEAPAPVPTADPAPAAAPKPAPAPSAAPAP